MAIETNSGIMGGKPVVKGTRIPIDLLLELVQEGFTVDDILSEYPHMNREDVLTVLKVAKDVHETVSYERLMSATEA